MTSTTPSPSADRYTESPKQRSQCKLCGSQTKCWKAFEKQDTFRGNDTYLGRICKPCIVAGRIDEL